MLAVTELSVRSTGVAKLCFNIDGLRQQLETDVVMMCCLQSLSACS